MATRQHQAKGRSRSKGKKEAREWRPTRKAMIRLGKLLDTLPAYALDGMADTWERLTPHISEQLGICTDPQAARPYFSRAATLIPLLSMLQPHEVKALEDAMVEAFLLGTFRRWQTFRGKLRLEVFDVADDRELMPIIDDADREAEDEEDENDEDRDDGYDGWLEAPCPRR